MDEDVRLPAGRQQPLVFGTIKPTDTSAAVAAGEAAGNIVRQRADAEVLDLPEVGPACGSGLVLGEARL